MPTPNAIMVIPSPELAQLFHQLERALDKLALVTRGGTRVTDSESVAEWAKEAKRLRLVFDSLLVSTSKRCFARAPKGAVIPQEERIIGLLHDKADVPF